MTTLEIVLLGIVWVSYGLYAGSVTHEHIMDASVWFAYVCAAPLILVSKMLYGAFKHYK